jgi:hypothetical protein
MLMNKLTLTKKRMLISVIAICIVAISGVTLWLNTRTVVQAAVISPHAGLVGWWRFDEGTGTIAGDSSGYGNNGTIYGATWVPGKYGTALSFNGLNNYVDVPANSVLFPTNAITIEFWVNITSTNINATSFMGFVCRNTRTNGLQVIKNWGDGRVFFETPGVGNLVSTIALTPGVWNQVVCVLVSSSSATIYINGQQQGTNGGWALPTTSMDYWFGRAAVGTTNPYLNGSLDEVHIYNRALSVSEVLQDYQQGPNFSADLLAKVPAGTTQVITTLSWQGTGSINVTIVSPSQNYTESMMAEYQKTTYSTSGGITSMLNIKRLSVSVNALPSAQNWYIVLTLNNVNAYQISVEVQS